MTLLANIPHGKYESLDTSKTGRLIEGIRRNLKTFIRLSALMGILLPGAAHSQSPFAEDQFLPRDKRFQETVIDKYPYSAGVPEVRKGRETMDEKEIMLMDTSLKEMLATLFEPATQKILIKKGSNDYDQAIQAIQKTLENFDEQFYAEDPTASGEKIITIKEIGKPDRKITKITKTRNIKDEKGGAPVIVIETITNKEEGKNDEIYRRFIKIGNIQMLQMPAPATAATQPVTGATQPATTITQMATPISYEGDWKNTMSEMFNISAYTLTRGKRGRQVQGMKDQAELFSIKMPQLVYATLKARGPANPWEVGLLEYLETYMANQPKNWAEWAANGRKFQMIAGRNAKTPDDAFEIIHINEAGNGDYKGVFGIDGFGIGKKNGAYFPQKKTTSTFFADKYKCKKGLRGAKNCR